MKILTCWIMILCCVANCYGLRADLNHDGRVDIADLAIFSEEWLMSLDVDTKLLLHFDTDFSDSSLYGHIVDVGSNPYIISSDESKFGGASAKNNGSNRFLVPAHEVFHFGDNWTIDYWVFPTADTLTLFVDSAASLESGIGFVWTSFLDQWDLVVERRSPNIEAKVRFTYNMPMDVWHHFALVRSGSSLMVFIDGDLKGTESISFETPGNMTMVFDNGGQLNPGYFDELRIVNGQAVWTSNFTPPTIAYKDPNDPNIETSRYIMNNIRNEIDFSIPVQYDNMDFDPPDSIWARLAIRLGASQVTTVVGNYRVTGILWVQLFSPLGDGLGAVYGQAKVVKDTFDTKVVCDMKFRAAKVEHIGRTRKWYQTNVSVPFTLDLPITI